VVRFKTQIIYVPVWTGPLIEAPSLTIPGLSFDTEP
jgi:hypothetical protein